MTIRELADELGISKQAVMKRIDTLGCRDELMQIGGQYQLDNALAETIRMYSMVVDRQPPTTNQVVDRQPPTTNQVVDRQPITYKLVSVLEDQIASKDKVIEQHQAEIERLRQQLAEQEQMIAALRMKANLYDEQKKLYEEALEQIAELKVKSALYERQEDEIAELKADKADLKRHRDNLTIALSMSKADLARLENVVTQMAALPLSTRIFSWSGTVQHLMEAKSSVDSNMAAEYVVVSEEDQTNNAE